MTFSIANNHENFATEQWLKALSGPLEEVRGLPNEVFTSPDFFELERQTLFSHSWVFVACLSDVPNIGDRIPVDVAGNPLFVIRDTKGEVRAFHNVCPHRGARIVPERNCAPAIVCPYHAWTFALEGDLQVRPHFHGPGQHDNGCENLGSNINLQEARTSQWGDWLFVNLDGKAIPFDDYIVAIKREWAEYDLSNIVHAHSLTVDYECNWKLAMENFSDFYHVFKVHPVLDNSLSDHKRRATLCEGAVMHNETWTHDGHSTISTMDNAPCLPDLGAPVVDNQRRTVFAVVFPNCALNIHHSDVQFSYFEALAPGLTRLHRHFYFLGTAATESRYSTVRDRLYEDWETVLREDESVCRLIQEGRKSRAYDGGRFAPEWDEGTRHFHRLVAKSVNLNLSGKSQD